MIPKARGAGIAWRGKGETLNQLPIILFALAAFFGAVGQFLYKSGAEKATGGIISYVLNPSILGGVACYMAVMVLFVAAFKRGGQPSVLYPVYASTFIWAALIAWLAYGIVIRPVHMAGMACLVLGMYLMGR